MDNGSEFTSSVFTYWAKAHGIKVDYNQPGCPYQNAYVERFNRTYRDEILDCYIFNNLNDVWIGNNCILKPGISIGDGAIIAGHSVVTKDIPAYSIFGGSPATFLRNRFPLPVCEKLIKLRWWNYKLEELLSLNCDFSNVELFCETLSQRIQSNSLNEANHSTLDLGTLEKFSL